MIEDALFFIKLLLLKIINCHIYFSHIRKFRKLYLRKKMKNIHSEFMVILIKKNLLYILMDQLISQKILKLIVVMTHD